MNEILDFMVRYGLLVLFVVVFIEQLGAPLPSPPFLLAAGGLAGVGKMNPLLALLMATLGSLLADTIWFYVGRHRGNRILKLLCRISLEPDSCVRRTEDVFVKHGMRGIVFAKFIPGLGTVMPPLAGMYRVNLRRFLAFDGFGAMLYVGCFLVLGLLFRNQLQEVAEWLDRLGRGAIILLASLLVAYIAFKYINRQRTLRKLHMARITAEELRQRQEAGQDIYIVDVRSSLAAQGDPYRIPGARHMLLDEVQKWAPEIPRDREVVLYCSCPNDASAVRAALALYKRGITRVRPLAGGIDAWRERSYPLESLTVFAGEETITAVPETQ
ncbi:MAG TPA: DedA family protein/thiosulfate sulfurtransferase GlpE [Verrucomicrobiae bacterium]|nr:DedA family protein/thiosulfate sulfurtransferase GlpE [Verrucomicrobiae bacterium]